MQPLDRTEVLGPGGADNDDYVLSGEWDRGCWDRPYVRGVCR